VQKSASICGEVPFSKSLMLRSSGSTIVRLRTRTLLCASCREAPIEYCCTSLTCNSAFAVCRNKSRDEQARPLQHLA
jgi:hypothetical protein